MEHKGTVSIETDRLILRKFRPDDSEAAFRNWTSDDKVTKFLTWPSHPDIKTTEGIIQMWVDGYADENFYQWAITLKEIGDEPIGTISVVSQKETLDILEIGYCIGSTWWHKGITSEALSGVIAFLFKQVKANRIEAKHDSHNMDSGKVMEKCGMKYEGTLRQAARNNQGVVDSAVYSILSEEYTGKAEI